MTILGAVPRMPMSTHYVMGLSPVHLEPGYRGEMSGRLPSERAHITRLMVMNEPVRYRHMPDGRWGRLKRIAWFSITARARMGDAVSITHLTVDGQSRLASPGSVDAAMFSPCAADAHIDFGEVEHTVRVGVRNDGYRPTTIYASVQLETRGRVMAGVQSVP